MATQNDPVVLSIGREEDRVLVIPQDRDLFLMRVKEAVEACRIFDRFKVRFEEQLDSLKDKLGEWIEQHSDRVQHAFLTLREDTFWFVVVMQGVRFDDDLEGDLSELVLEIASNPEFSAINFDAQMLPFCSEACYKSFCNPAWSIEYRKRDADRQGAHQPGAA
jgi:hypothetical protein